MTEETFAKKRDEVLQAMITFDAGDAKRIQHFLKVYTYATLLGRQEGLHAEVQQTLELAAILQRHRRSMPLRRSTGALPASTRKKRGQHRRASCSKKSLASPIPWSSASATSSAIITPIKMSMGADYQLLLEADFLVNAYEDALSPKAILAFREKVFRTASGTAMLNAVYGLD